MENLQPMSTDTEITQADQDAFDDFMSQLFEVDLATSLQMVQEAVAEIEKQEQTDDTRFMLQFLASLWDFFKAFLIVKESADFAQAQALLQRAYQTFEQLELSELKDLAYSWLLYFSAIVDLRTLNLSSGLEKIKQAKTNFNKLDKFGQFFGEQRDSMEAESLFISGLSYFTQLDYDNGYIAIGKASRAYKKVASKYYQPEDAEYKQYMGYGFLYGAFGQFFSFWEKLNRFDFDFFDDPENEALEDYQKATQYLSEIGSVSEVARVNLKLSKGLDLLSQVIFYIGDCMNDLLAHKPDDRKLDIKVVRRKLDNAQQFFEDIGEMGIVYYRLCKQLNNQLKSLGQYIKKSDMEFVERPEPRLSPERVKQLVGEGKNRQALAYLLEHTDELDIYDSILLTKGSYEEFRRNVVKGIVDADYQKQQEAIFANRILEILKHL